MVAIMVDRTTSKVEESFMMEVVNLSRVSSIGSVYAGFCNDLMQLLKSSKISRGSP